MYCAFIFFVFCAFINNVVSDADKDFNLINKDGSFSFGLSNSDTGGHYHSASGSTKTLVQGRYGSRSPVTGRIEETVYTAGPRGFRARGPAIHRKMDLSQVPRGPIGTPDDPLADPYDSPRYGFGFRTANYQRREDADDNGRVTGLYSYLDDIGERHSVRYAAGAGTGFEVLNAVPDALGYVRYNAPLYKTNRLTRGRIAYERGPGRQYKFVASGADQRRSERTDADGITRGSYSYLDDKGMQRTVEYIAGAGIGYRVVKSTVGPGTHQIPRSTINDFRPTIHPIDITDEDGSGFKTAESGLTFAQSGNANNRNSNTFGNRNNPLGFNRKGNRKNNPFANNNNAANNRYNNNKHNINADDYNDDNHINNDDDDDDDDNIYDFNRDGDISLTTTNIGGNNSKTKQQQQHTSSTNNPLKQNNDNNLNKNSNTKHERHPPASSTTNNNIIDGRNDQRGNTKYQIKDNGNSYDDYDIPFVTDNEFELNDHRKTAWQQHGRDSTVVKNVGEYYVTLPPGTAVRAHVQNIDLLPLGGRTISPSEALRIDEQKSNSNF